MKTEEILNNQKISKFAELLATEGIEFGFLGPNEKDKILDRHILNSASLVDFLVPEIISQNQPDTDREISKLEIPEGKIQDQKNIKQKILDFGTGAGLPGLVLAILQPENQFTLIDAREKRINWVKKVAQELELPNVEALHLNLNSKTITSFLTQYDFVVSRAVSNLASLISTTKPLLKPNGKLLFLKGETLNSEIKEAQKSSLLNQNYSIETTDYATVFIA